MTCEKAVRPWFTTCSWLKAQEGSLLGRPSSNRGQVMKLVVSRLVDSCGITLESELDSSGQRRMGAIL